MRLSLVLLCLVSLPSAARAQSDAELAALPHRGAPPGAPVVVVEVSDFQCPFCAKLAPVLDRLVESYPTTVTHYYLDYPLPFHHEAFKAHEAAACAAREGRFWEMHQRLFENQRALQVPDLLQYGAELGLDSTRFSACVQGGQLTNLVTQHLELSKSLGVTGTPTVFVNGEKVSGARPYEDFDAAVRRAMNRPPQGAGTPPVEAQPLTPEAPPSWDKP